MCTTNVQLWNNIETIYALTWCVTLPVRHLFRNIYFPRVQNESENLMPGCVRIETTLGQYRRCARQILTNVADISLPRSHISPVPSLNGTILRNTRRWKAYDTGCGYSNLVRSIYKSRAIGLRFPLISSGVNNLTDRRREIKICANRVYGEIVRKNLSLL